MNRIGRLNDILNKPSRKVLGLMSGTSVDAIDAALTEIEGHGQEANVSLIAFDSFPFPAEVRARIFKLFDPATARIDDICEYDFLLGELFAGAATELLHRHSINPAEVDIIGSAGQTIWHAPVVTYHTLSVDWMKGPIGTRSTMAIGQSAVIAERTGIITVGDLRVRDVAAGGHGAPLICYADWVMLRDAHKGRCIQNIGGIGNVTYLPPGAELEQVVGFDTGPGNMVIDALADVATGGKLKYDRDGKLAAKGRVHESILSGWLDDPYFRKQPPKTTGREHFGVQFARRALTEAQGVPVEDLIATATALTAHSIARAYHDFLSRRGPVDEVIIGGGGSQNPTLLAMLRTLLAHAKLLTHEDLGINSKAKEAIGIAIIANDSLMGLNSNVPAATGGRPTVLGKINL